MAEDPQPLADRLEREAEQLERRSEELRERVEEARREHDRERDEPALPGGSEAQPVPDPDGPGVADDA